MIVCKRRISWCHVKLERGRPNIAVPHYGKNGVNARWGVGVSLDVIENRCDRLLAERLERYVVISPRPHRSVVEMVWTESPTPRRASDFK